MRKLTIFLFLTLSSCASSQNVGVVGNSVPTSGSTAPPGVPTLVNPTNSQSGVKVNTAPLTCTATGSPTSFSLTGDFGTFPPQASCSFAISAPLIGNHTYSVTVTATNAGGSTSGGPYTFSTESAWFTSTSAGSDSNTCTQARNPATPKASFTGPSNNGAGGLGCLATGGDTLYARAGTYAEQLVDPITVASGSSGSQVTVKAYNSEVVWLKPTLPSSGPQYIVLLTGTHHYIVFDGIRIDCSAVTTQCTPFYVQSGPTDGENTDHITYQNSEILGNRVAGTLNTSGVLVVLGWKSSDAIGGNQIINNKLHGSAGNNYGYGFYAQTNNNIFDGNEIYDVGSLGGEISNISANPTGNIVRNNKVHDVISGSTTGNQFRIGIDLEGTANEAYNNVIYNINTSGDSDTSANVDGFNVNGSNQIVYNNTMTAISGGQNNAAIEDATSGSSYINNLAWNNGVNGIVQFGSSGLTITTNSWQVSLSSNPFVNSSSTPPNLALASGSVVIGAGTDESSTFTTDILGLTRTDPWDIGAYKYGPSGSNITRYSSSSGAGGVGTQMWTQSCPAMNPMIVVCDFDAAGGTPTVTYGSTTLTQVAYGTQAGVGAYGMFYAVGVASGSNTVTLSNSITGHTLQGTSACYSGTLQSSQPDASNSGGTATSNISLNITVVASNSWAVMCASDQNGGSPSWTSPLTAVQSNSSVYTNQANLSDSNGVVSTGSFTGAFTDSTSSAFGAVLMSIKHQ